MILETLSLARRSSLYTQLKISVLKQGRFTDLDIENLIAEVEISGCKTMQELGVIYHRTALEV